MLMESPLEAVFISDLHLHPDNSRINDRFNQFIDWAVINTRSLYILGDFFHVWPGDDGIEPWSLAIQSRLKWLASQGVMIYFMHGNRDFLMGNSFINNAGMQCLYDPTRIQLHNTTVLLTHGDQFCTKDRAHQWFRRLTRNRLFSFFFLLMPLAMRQKMVSRVRRISQSNLYNPETMNTVPAVILNCMHRYQVTNVIHGHTHKPGLTELLRDGTIHRVWVLSDWDDNPSILCYHKSKGFYFTHCNFV